MPDKPTRENPEIDEKELLEWIRHSVQTRSNIYSHGYQGCVYLYTGEGGRKLIIKTPTGRGLMRYVRTKMLEREFKAYSKLPPMDGIPRCIGFLDGLYLVLEFVEGIPIYKAEIEDHKLFFDSFLALIKKIHAEGVAHTDLKKKDNVLVVDGKKPCIIDFGVSVIKKKGFSPLNAYLYNTSRIFDFNAWVKLKYDGKYEEMSEEDSKYYHRLLIEEIARCIREPYLSIKIALLGRK